MNDTCLAQHVGGDGNGGPDDGVDREEDHPEGDAAPNRQVGELGHRRGKGQRDFKGWTKRGQIVYIQLIRI